MATRGTRAAACKMARAICNRLAESCPKAVRSVACTGCASGVHTWPSMRHTSSKDRTVGGVATTEERADAARSIRCTANVDVDVAHATHDQSHSEPDKGGWSTTTLASEVSGTSAAASVGKTLSATSDTDSACISSNQTYRLPLMPGN